MENKPKFCSECGAKLTGSAAFCPECGAKQQLAPAPAPASEPAPAPAPAPVSVEAPETSLAAPKKLGMSVPALIIAIVALMTAGLAFLLQFIAISRNYKFTIDFSLIGKYLRNRGVLTGMLTCGIVPIIAILVTIIKKKPVAIIGLALTAVCFLCQVMVACAYGKLMQGQVSVLFKILPLPIITLTNMINGEGLFYDLLRNIRFGITNPRVYLGANMMSMALYWFKNVLALASCLLVVLKKKK